MKNFLLLLSLSWLMIGCSVNVTEKEFVGTYTYNTTEHVDEDDQNHSMDMTISGTTIYNADRTLSEKGTISIGLQVDEDDYSNYITLIYSISCKGSWTLTGGNELTEQCSINDVSIEYQDMKLKNIDETGVMTAAYMIGDMAEVINDVKEEMSNGITSKIVSFSENRIELKDVDDGTRFEYTRTAN